jgi:actin-related protein
LYSKESREKILQLAFEKFQVPAAFLSRDSVLSSFTAGKSTSLIVDIGASSARITPVFDGYALLNGFVHQQIAGDYLSAQCDALFEKEQGFSITPHYLVKSKKIVELNKPPHFTKRSFDFPITESFQKFSKLRVLDDFKESVLQSPEGIYDER